MTSPPFAIGLYLPLSLSTPIMVGGVIAYVLQRTSRDKLETGARNLRGILFASGIVAGDALIGVLVAFLISTWGTYAAFYDRHEGMMNTLSGSFGPWLSLIMFFLLALMLGWLGFRGLKKKV